MAAYWYQAHYGFADPFAMYASAWSPVSHIRDHTKGDAAQANKALFLADTVLFFT